MAKLLGYILSAVGIVGIAAYSIPEIYSSLEKFAKTATGNPSFALNATGVLIVSVVLVLGGLFLAVKSGNSHKTKGAEVPIYHGKNVVGYRRH